MIARLGRWLLGPEIAVLHRFFAPPYGGGNQFLLALVGELRDHGIDIRGARGVGRRTRACLFNSHTFDPAGLEAARRAGCRKVHRVDGPIGVHRPADIGIDRRISGVNEEFADATIVQSRYSLEAHESMGVSFRAPVVIPNAADPRIFFSSARTWDPDRKVRLISTSWSDNPEKGAATYKWLEERLDWRRFEYTFIGRSPLRFDRIRQLPPMASSQLADELRAHDIYITASRNDGCSNALIEALTCGLPALALRSGGNSEVVGEGGRMFDGIDDVLDKLTEIVEDYPARVSAIKVTPLAEAANRYLSVLLPASFG